MASSVEIAAALHFFEPSERSDNSRAQAVQTILNQPTLASAPIGLHRPNSPATALKLGLGYSTLNGESRGVAAPTDGQQSDPHEGQQIVYGLTVIESIEQLREVLAISAEASFMGAGANLSAKHSYAKSTEINRYSSYVVVSVRVSNAETTLSARRLRDETATFAAESTVEQFFKRFGDRVIIGKTTGGELYGVVEFLSSSKAEQESINAEIKLAAGSWSGDAEFTHSISKLSTHHTTHVKILKNGGYDKIPDDKHLISAAQGFPAEVKQDTGHPVDFSYITRGYEIFDNWPSSKPAPSLIKERATLKRLAADRDLLLSLVADIQYITSNPFQFGNPDIDALKLKRQNAERLLQAVQLTGEAFAENPFLNHDLPTLDLSNILPLPQRRHDYTLPLAIRVHPNALQPLDFPANEWAGTTKQFRPLERFSVKFEPAVPGLSITYDVSGQFFQEFGGWRSFALGGHDGILTPDDPHDPFRRSYMLGTIRFRLTGELAKHYDVSYQTHNKNVGDSAVAKNGQVIGYGPTGSDMIWVEAIKVWVTAKN